MKIEELQDLLKKSPDRKDVSIVLPRTVYAQLLKQLEVAERFINKVNILGDPFDTGAAECLARMEALEAGEKESG